MKLAIYIALLTLIAIPQANGIVIRHDVSDKKYQELGGHYSSSVAYIGGCVSTLVEPDWLMTAAHCMGDEGENLEAATHLESRYLVEKIIIHPSSDIALVQLKEPVRNGKPVNLYNQTNEVGQAVVLVGNGVFGNGRDGLMEDDGMIRGATNTVIETTPYNIVFLFNTPETATSLEGISGPGDSGGPALVEMNERLYVVGVSAFQKGNGFEEGHYGVKEYYSRVSTHYPWLREIIDSTKPAYVPEH